jgi:hypothetical protein
MVADDLMAEQAVVDPCGRRPPLWAPQLPGMRPRAYHCGQRTAGCTCTVEKTKACGAAGAPAIKFARLCKVPDGECQVEGLQAGLCCCASGAALSGSSSLHHILTWCAEWSETALLLAD